MIWIKINTGKRTFKNGKREDKESSLLELGIDTSGFKLLELGKIEMPDSGKITDQIKNAAKTGAEYETVSKSSHPNILKFFTFFDIKKQENDIISDLWKTVQSS